MSARWLVAVMWCVAACAEAAEPTVRVHVVGTQPVVAGQSVQIEITVLAPNFFLSAPVFPAMQVPGAVITMPDERGVNSTETIDGVSFAGIRKTYVLTAQTGGDFALPTPTLHFTYAGDDGKPRDASVSLPPTTIHAGGQGAGAASQPSAGASTLPAGRLHIEQQFDRPIDGKDANLRAGDALVRTVTIFAPGAPAMMIEPPDFKAPRGVRQFRADPLLRDGVAATGDEPAGATGGRRVETITYVFERSGRFTLPAASVAWFDPASGKRALSTAPAVTVDVARAPAGMGLAPTGAPWQLPDWADWRAVVAACAVLVIAAAGVWYGRRHAWRSWHWPWRATQVDERRRHDGSRLPPLNP